MKFKYSKGTGLSADDELISEFYPVVTGIRECIHLDTGLTNTSFLVKIIKIDGTETEEKEILDLKDIRYFDLWHVEDALLSVKQKQYLYCKLQQDVMRLKVKRVVVIGQGLYYYKDIYIYQFGGRIQTDRKMPDNESIECNLQLPLLKNNFEIKPELIKEYINFLPGVSEVLFYGALFAVIKPVLCKLGFNPNFIISLIGPSGHLKTSMVRKYALWLADSGVQEISFSDPMQSEKIISMIDNIPGQNFLIDDLHELKSSYAVGKQRDKLDRLVHHGDHDSNFANIFITGESAKKMGIFSCKDRMLIITVDRMESEKMAEMKKKIGQLSSEYMAEVAENFWTKIMENYDDVQKFIGEYMEKNQRQEGIDYGTRTFQHMKYITLTEELFRKYMCCGASEYSGKEKLEKALERNYIIQQKELKSEGGNKADWEYVMDVYQMLGKENQYLKMVTNMMEYEPNYDNYFMKRDRIYVTGTALLRGMRRYYQHDVDGRKILAILHNIGVLDEDATSARTKKLKNVRHYVLIRSMIEEYLSYYRKN